MKPLETGVIPPHHDNCFGCGPGNPAGLRMTMRAEGDKVVASLTLDERHQGSPGLAHGGVIATVLDDLFGGVLVLVEAPAVTASLSVEYRRPVPLGVPLDVVGRCVGSEGRKLQMHGTISHAGEVLAEATAVFVRVDIAHFKRGGAIPEEWLRWGRS